jgi:penicillin-binding protein 1C
VGSSGTLSQASEVDGVTALRQPGSTLKPFLYAQAIAEKRITAASLIEDSSAHIPTQNGLYIPQNYDRRFKGWVSARTALASSLNVPAVRTLVMVTPDAFFEQLKKLGLPLRESGGYYGFSLALGSSEVALLNLTNAYRALGNGGQYRPVSWALPQTESRKAGGKTGDDAVQALDARAAFIVGDILSDNMARAPTFGTDSVLATRFWTAVKTGTSKDMRDNWAVGWSERYTVGVWVGNAGGEAMHSVSGTSGAAPIWAEIMGFCIATCPAMRPGTRWRAAAASAVRCAGQRRHAHRKRVANGLWKARSNRCLPWITWLAVQSRKACRQKGSKSGSAAAAAAVRISRPANGTILALDPDIPPDSQRVQLVARQAGMAAEQDWRDSSLRWRLVTRQYGAPATADKNAQPVMREVQRELGRGSQLGWLPWPGATGWSCSMPPARCWTALRSGARCRCWLRPRGHQEKDRHEKTAGWGQRFADGHGRRT